MRPLGSHAVVCAILATLALASSATAQVRISYVGKGAGLNPNAFNGQFIELYNPGPGAVALDGKSLQWASSASSSSWTKLDLHGTIEPGGYWLARLTSPLVFGIPFTADLDRIGFNGLHFSLAGFGAQGKVALVDSTATLTTPGCTPPQSGLILDLVSWNTTPATAGCFEGVGSAVIRPPGLFAEGVGTTEVLRLGGGTVDTNDNLADFTSTARPPRNSGYPGPVDVPAVSGMTQVTGQTGRGVDTAYAGQTVLFTSGPSAISGSITAVTIDLSLVGGSPNQPLNDDGFDGDAVAGDGVYSFLYTVPPSAVLGRHVLAISATDSVGRSGVGYAPLTVAPTPPANDLCGGAEVIPSGPLPLFVSATGNLISAGPITRIATSCTTNSGSAGTSRDVWYAFTPVETAFYSVTTCNSVTAPGLFTSQSTVVTIHPTCPDDDATDLSGHAWACNDNGCSNFIGGSPSTISSFPMSEGVTYFIRVARSGSGDGVVGAPFRLDIISEPFGACCFPNGVCTTMLAAECASGGGVFWGDGTTCSSVTCPPPPPPANNECSDALELSAGEPAPGTTYGASGADITACDLTSWDVWYTFTPHGGGEFRITATLLSGAQTPAISVFDSCPPVPDTELACARVPMSGSVNTLEFAGTPGTQYLIRVATNFSQRSEFTVVADLIDGPPPCLADWNNDGAVNSSDLSAFITSWLDSVQNGNLIADFNGDNAVNSSDLSAFITAWLAAVTGGC